MFRSLLPRNRTPVEVQIEQTLAVKYGNTRLDADIIRKIHEPWECPVELLPWLAWSLSVDVWDDGWSEQTKRRVIAASIEIHRKKGTVGAVRATLEALGISEFSIKESFNDERVAKGFFYVEVDANSSALDSAVKQSQVRSAIDKVKKLSAHYAVLLNDDAQIVQSGITSLFGLCSDGNERIDYRVDSIANVAIALDAAGNIRQTELDRIAFNAQTGHFLSVLFANTAMRQQIEPVVKIASRDLIDNVEKNNGITVVATVNASVMVSANGLLSDVAEITPLSINQCSTVSVNAAVVINDVVGANAPAQVLSVNHLIAVVTIYQGDN